MSNKYLFLDFDRVLNSQKWVMVQHKLGVDIDMTVDLDRTAVKRLNKIVKWTDCKVVISSSWRIIFSIPYLTLVLKRHGFEGEILGVTPNLNTERGVEIQSWMTDNDIRAHQIAILDDDSDMAHLKHRHVKTSFAYGLTEAEANKVIHLLKQGDQHGPVE